MRLIRMHRKANLTEPLPTPTVGIPIKTTSKRIVSIDVKCKKYTMQFPSDFGQHQTASNARKPNTVKEKKSRSAKSKSKERTTSAGVKKLTELVVGLSTEGDKLAIEGPSSSRRKADVLGTLNVVSNSKATSDRKRGKRKRLFGEDTEVSAENIPLEAVFPVLQFGINKGICPKKRRRLQSLLSPKSPSPSQFFSD